jgi:Biotin-requiring enzyme/e3 binding domain
MTEGNIASWKVKEGDSFSAGDILLEIETDKASMDVEAQDDGIMAKITQGDGSKGIKVGTRIGVIAEPGDDLSSLEIPAEDSPAKSSAKEESKGAPEPAPSTPSQPAKPSGPPKKQAYPLLPSVERLLHEHGLDASAVEKMTPTGPNNRLLKGDVLAYLGSIPPSYPREISARIDKLSHLDLSNIKLAPPPAQKATTPAEPAPEPVIEDLEVAVPVSMKAVIEVQKRIQSTLGVFIPLSTFIARATDVANDNLPRSKSYEPTADELFTQILGLDNVTSSNGFRGSFLPQITALPELSPASKPSRHPSKDADIIDILAGNAKPSKPSFDVRTPSGISNAVNVFSVRVPKGDEKQAEVFLERVKAVLESEPGRLVL